MSSAIAANGCWFTEPLKRFADWKNKPAKEIPTRHLINGRPALTLHSESQKAPHAYSSTECGGTKSVGIQDLRSESTSENHEIEYRMGNENAAPCRHHMRSIDGNSESGAADLSDRV